MAVSQEVRNYLYRLHQVVAAATTTADACWAAAAGVVELCGGQAGVWLGEGPEGALTAGYAVHDGQSQRLAPPADGRVDAALLRPLWLGEVPTLWLSGAPPALGTDEPTLVTAFTATSELAGYMVWAAGRDAALAAELLPGLARHLGAVLRLHATPVERRPSDLFDGLRDVLDMADELVECDDLDELCRRATELVRQRLGCDRTGLYLAEPDGLHMRGTFGTSSTGETVDERHLRITTPWLGQFRQNVAAGQRYSLFYGAHREVRDGEGHNFGEGWIGVTLVHSKQSSVGVFFNDTSLTGRPPDALQQELLAVFCSLLGGYIERLRAEQALRTSEDLLRVVLSNSPVLLAATDSERRVRLLDGRVLQDLGGRRSDWLGRDLAELASRWPEVAHAVDRAAAGERASALFQVGGRTLHVWCAPLPADGQQTPGLVAVATDITVLRRAEEALELSQQRYRAVVEDQTELICRFRPDGVLTFVNEAYCRYFGRARTALLGSSFVPRIHPDDQQRVTDYMAAITPDQPISTIQHRVIDDEGQTRWLEMTNRGLLDETGRIVELQAVGRDITGQREVQDALVAAKDAAEAANRAKAEFLANMSHELRTPLNSIVGLTELTLLGALTDEQRGHLETARASAVWLTSMLDELLDYAAVEATGVGLSPTAFNLREMLLDVVLALAPQAHAKGLALLHRVEPEVPERVTADVGRLRQVLANLLHNAIKFTPAGHVLLRVAVADDGPEPTLRMVVEDTGVGVPEDRQEAVFEAFVQADTSSTRQYGGTGLGLTIARRLARSMAGEVTLTSRPGEGTRVTATVRVGRRDPQPAPEPAPLDSGAVVLCVGFDGVTSGLLGEMLADWWLAAASAEHLGDRAPAVVLVDADGVTAGDWQVVRQASAGPDAAVIVLESPSSPAPPREFATASRLSRPLRQDRLRQALAARRPVPASVAPVRATAADGLVAQRSERRVLVVEDNDANRDLAGLMLARAGYGYELVDSGAEALDRMAAEAFDLILMDVQMPGLDGFAVTHRIREQFGAQPLIVALTAHAMKGDRERCLAAGMDGYLAKPFRPGELFDLLDGLLLADQPT